MSASSLSELVNSASSSQQMAAVKTTRCRRTALLLINNHHKQLLTSWEWSSQSSRNLRRRSYLARIQTRWRTSSISWHSVTRRMRCRSSSAFLTSTITRSTTWRVLSLNLLCSLRSQKWRLRTMQRGKWNNALLNSKMPWQKTWLSLSISSLVSWEASLKVGSTSQATTNKQLNWHPKTNRD